MEKEKLVKTSKHTITLPREEYDKLVEDANNAYNDIKELKEEHGKRIAELKAEISEKITGKIVVQLVNNESRYMWSSSHVHPSDAAKYSFCNILRADIQSIDGTKAFKEWFRTLLQQELDKEAILKDSWYMLNALLEIDGLIDTHYTGFGGNKRKLKDIKELLDRRRHQWQQ